MNMGGMPGMPNNTGGMMPDFGGGHHAAVLPQLLADAEEFNSGPHFVRPTLSRLPGTMSAKQKANVPLGVTFQPLSPVPPGYPEVPLVSPNSSGMGAPRASRGGAGAAVVRCKNCRAYINPFVKWEQGGQKWSCNVCGFSNETPNTYFSPLDERGRRIDLAERPELHSGAVEYCATEEYTMRTPQPPVMLFLLDVTRTSVQSGFLQECCQAIKSCILQECLPGGERAMVGIMTFDSSVQFYNLDPDLQSPQMIVVSDLEDIFLPLPEDILVNVTESQDALINLLDQLPTLYADTIVNESCMLCAVKGAYLAMKHVGGKLVVFSSIITTLGEGALKPQRENPRLIMTDKEVELFNPMCDDWKQLGQLLTVVQVCLEMFIGAQGYMDLATVATLAKQTGGDVRYYEQFNPAQHGMKLRKELRHIMTRNQGWEAVMRVRVSRGWKITKFYGHMHIRGQDLLMVPNCHQDASFAITIDMDQAATPEPVCCVQSALLYTNSLSERRIRVHTYNIVTSNVHSEIMESIDTQATAAVMMTVAMERALQTTMNDARSLVYSTCQSIMQAAHGLAKAQEAVQYLPMLVLGLLKTEAFRGTNEIPFDRRMGEWYRLNTLCVNGHAAYYFPRLLKVSHMSGMEGQRTQNEDGSDAGVQLPAMVGLTKNNISVDSAYLLDNGQILYLWIAANISPQWLQSIFGVSELQSVNPGLPEDQLLVDNGTDPQQRLLAVIDAIREERQVPFMRLQVIRQGDPYEQKFLDGLVEDARAGLQVTYQEFLAKMTRANVGGIGPGAPMMGGPPGPMGGGPMPGGGPGPGVFPR